MPSRTPRPRPGWRSTVCATLLLAACAEPRLPTVPMPTQLVPATQTGGHVLVIVLPGRGDDLSDLAHTGMAAAVQRVWPKADVLLVGATRGYYSDGKLAQRLHEQVLLPMRQRGYSEIWLSGASMGGMGTLLYEQAYPHDVTGLVLYAPYMGEKDLIEQISKAGGVQSWDAGPKPTTVDAQNYQHELWRLVQGWRDPHEAARVWLVCGADDRLLPAARLMAPLLPAGHFILPPGGHDWPVWDAGAAQVFPQIAVQQP